MSDVDIEQSQILAIDFDGTVTETQSFPEIGELAPYAKEVINQLHKEGYYIIIWSCRCEYSLIDMIRFLDEQGIHYDKVNENAGFDKIGFKPSPKIFYNILIDDRNLGGFPGWCESYKIITGKKFSE